MTTRISREGAMRKRPRDPWRDCGGEVHPTSSRRASNANARFTPDCWPSQPR
jgi:hypothetical protein